MCSVRPLHPFNGQEGDTHINEQVLLDKLQEIQDAAPNLFSVLSSALHIHALPCVERRQANASSRHVNSSAILSFCTAILCRYCNQLMKLVQHLFYCTITVQTNKWFKQFFSTNTSSYAYACAGVQKVSTTAYLFVFFNTRLRTRNALDRILMSLRTIRTKDLTSGLLYIILAFS